MLRLILFILFSFYLLGVNSAQGSPVDISTNQMNNVSSIMQKAREDAQKMTLPVNKHTEEGLKAAKKTADVFHSPEFQKRIQFEQQRLEEEVFEDYIASWKKKKSASGKSNQSGSLTATEKVYLLSSSSVPGETVHSYLSAIARVGDPNVTPVMRGLIGGMADLKAGKEDFSRILKQDPGCRDAREPCQRYQIVIKMKPSLFTKHNITQVPAVVYENKKETFIIQGDARLDYLLERINREVAKEDTGLAGLIKKIRGVH